MSSMHIWWSSPTTIILILGSFMEQLWTVKDILSIQGLLDHGGNIPTISNITDCIGEGCDTRKISRYFNKENNMQINKKKFPWLHQNNLNKHTSCFQQWKKWNWQWWREEESYSSLNIICLPLNLKIYQFASDMFQYSKMIISHSTLRKIWYYPCHISLLLI